jgi:hypothetical protein
MQWLSVAAAPALAVEGWSVEKQLGHVPVEFRQFLAVSSIRGLTQLEG